MRDFSIVLLSAVEVHPDGRRRDIRSDTSLLVECQFECHAKGVMYRELIRLKNTLFTLSKL